MNEWVVDELTNELMVALTGLVFVMVVAVELTEAVEVVQVVAVEFSWHFTEVPAQPWGMMKVLVVLPEIIVVPLNHCQTLAPVFSESESVSDQVPLLQVRV